MVIDNYWPELTTQVAQKAMYMLQLIFGFS